MRNTLPQSAIQSHSLSPKEKVAAVVENFSSNKAYRYRSKGGDPDQSILRSYQARYTHYREAWNTQPKLAVEKFADGGASELGTLIPLCVDIEIAAICDLACPFCFRQHIITPDKIIDEGLYKSIIDQCADMGVPSIKLNWRGEPLLHPKIGRFIDYAKKKDILDVIINTNATTLSREKSRVLIKAGLDQIIYSFDGASALTYEKMRVGRFKKNSFDQVYENIQAFAEERDALNSFFPRTKIQMILTQETFPEQDRFFRLFDNCVDDVSVKAYTERGGQLADLDTQSQEKLRPTLDSLGLDLDTPYWRDWQGNLFYSKGRNPCAQPFQRLMVTYDGRVSMCCYDWGSEHPVGYVDEKGYNTSGLDFQKVANSIKRKRKGFHEFMSTARLPTPYCQPDPIVSSLADIWSGQEINRVRRDHCAGRVDDVQICKHCPFKETYDWQRLED